MSTSLDSRVESKQQDSRSVKDDQKQQASLRKQSSGAKKGAKDEDVAVDGGSGLVGGTMQAVQHAVDSAASTALHMLPTSVQTKATEIGASLSEQASSLKERAAPVLEAYQSDGIVAGLKTAGSVGVSAAGELKTAAVGAASGAAAGIRSHIPGLKGETVEQAPKKHGRRRRGGRGHGNRKHKLRELHPVEQESIVDTLGDKAAQLKEVVVEDVKPAGTGETGIIGSIRSKASGIVDSVSSTVQSSVSGVKSTAAGLVSGATDKASGLVHGAQDKIASFTSSKSAKPKLDRQDELASLGSPATPAQGDVVLPTKSTPMAVNPGGSSAPGQGGILATAAFYKDQIVDALKDKVDNASLNADDDAAADDNATTLDKAKRKLNAIKQAVEAKADDDMQDKLERKKASDSQ